MCAATCSCPGEALLFTAGDMLVAIRGLLVSPMSSFNLSVLNWNVRGLNCPNRRSTVNEIIATSACHLVCIQESKFQVVDATIAAFLGGFRLKGFAQRPAIGMRGGILLL